MGNADRRHRRGLEIAGVEDQALALPRGLVPDEQDDIAIVLGRRAGTFDKNAFSAPAAGTERVDLNGAGLVVVLQLGVEHGVMSHIEARGVDITTPPPGKVVVYPREIAVMLRVEMALGRVTRLHIQTPFIELAELIAHIDVSAGVLGGPGNIRAQRPAALYDDLIAFLPRVGDMEDHG